MESAPCILLVDDHADNLQVLYQCLDNLGYRLLVARSGEQALDIVGQTQPDLILLDIMMPGRDGYQVCQQLQSNEQHRSIKVIFLSALDDIDAKVKGFDVGGVDYISKPFQAAEVRARVELHLRMQKLEQQLKKDKYALEHENAFLLQSMTDGVLGLDGQGRVATANAAAAAILRSTEESLIARLVTELKCLPEDLAQQLLVACQNQERFSILQAQMDDGVDRTYITLHAEPILEQESSLSMVVLLRDISERVGQEQKLFSAREQLDQQRQTVVELERRSTLGAMAGGIAHELNQPLTAIANYASAAKRFQKNVSSGDKEAAEKLDQVLNKISSQVERASEVISNARRFLTDKTVDIDKINLCQVVDDSVLLAEVESKNLSVPINKELPEQAVWVNVNAVQVQQIILNLLRNAMEAMQAAEDKGQGVYLRLGCNEEAATIDVIDSGHGITAEQEETLFHPFQSHKAEGMGIGLSLSRDIAQRFSGDVVYIKQEVGSCFRLQLPIAD